MLERFVIYSYSSGDMETGGFSFLTRYIRDVKPPLESLLD